MLPNFTKIRRLIQQTYLLTEEDKMVLNENLTTLKKLDLLSVEKSLEMNSAALIRPIFKKIAERNILGHILEERPFTKINIDDETKPILSNFKILKPLESVGAGGNLEGNPYPAFEKNDNGRDKISFNQNAQINTGETAFDIDKNVAPPLKSESLIGIKKADGIIIGGGTSTVLNQQVQNENDKLTAGQQSSFNILNPVPVGLPNNMQNTPISNSQTAFADNVSVQNHTYPRSYEILNSLQAVQPVINNQDNYNNPPNNIQTSATIQTGQYINNQNISQDRVGVSEQNTMQNLPVENVTSKTRQMQNMQPQSSQIQADPVQNAFLNEAPSLQNSVNNLSDQTTVLNDNLIVEPNKANIVADNLGVRSTALPVINKSLSDQELAKIEEKEINVEWKSSIEDVDYTGEEVLSLVNFDEAKIIAEPINLETINDFRQLIKIDSNILDFKQNESGERLIYNFVQNISKSIPKGQGLALKRSILLAYIRSPLFYKYISTGIAGLNYKYNRDPEILNKMGDVSSDYLNMSKFKYASLLTAELRGFASI